MKEFLNLEIEEGVWQWDTAASPVDLCNGWLKGFLADATVIDVVGTTLSASNIITELQKVYDAIPNTIIDDERTRILISPARQSSREQHRCDSFAPSVFQFLQLTICIWEG
jgi:hypothetical protein